MTTGPLAGIRILELSGIGPGPHAAMLLADMGADVVTVMRPGELAKTVDGWSHTTRRGRRIVEIDLKSPEGVEQVLALVEKADVLVEGYRPGVTDRMGIGPDTCSARNEKIVYARMTGWGQEGPMAQTAGHDINYISLTGHLHAMARQGERPYAPLNLVGDFGGGSMFLVTGILAALLERTTSGKGQVIDAAMTDGAAVLGQFMWAMRSRGQWQDTPGVNMLDSGYPFYDVYETADNKYMAVGCLEPHFYAVFAEKLGIDGEEHPSQFEFARWGELRELITAKFAEKTRDEWAEIFQGTDACTTPVLTYGESVEDEHMKARGIYQQIGDDVMPGPAPRFSRSDAGTPAAPPTDITALADIWA